MWLAPKWIIKDVKERRKEDKLEELELNKSAEKIYKCINCDAGFKLSDNHKTACKNPQNIYFSQVYTFNCCGRDVDGEPCLIGWSYLK